MTQAMTEMDKGQYQEIQALIIENSMISGFDLYYLGFLSYYSSQLTLQNIFTHMRNIISLYGDGLITNEEKIEFLLRIVAKKVDMGLLKALTLASATQDAEAETKRILGDYFGQILKLIPRYGSINRFELFYLGRFHAICPSYKIAEIFQHVNNINVLVSEDLIDEETQVDFLLKILNKKIKANNGQEKALNIPKDQDIKPKPSIRDDIVVKSEEGEPKERKPSDRQEISEVKNSPIQKQQNTKPGNEERKERPTDTKSQNDRDNRDKDKSSEGNSKKSSGENENLKDKGNTRREGDKKSGPNQGQLSNDYPKISKIGQNDQLKVLKEKNTEERQERNQSRLNDLTEQKKKFLESKQSIGDSDGENREDREDRTIEDESMEVIEDSENSKSNASTSIGSGDQVVKKNNRKAPFLLSGFPGGIARTSADGMVGTLIQIGRINNAEEVEEDDKEILVTQNKNKIKKPGSGIRELIRRNSGKNDGKTRPSQVLPPLPSERQSQVSNMSEKPLIVQWKKRTLIAGLEKWVDQEGTCLNTQEDFGRENSSQINEDAERDDESSDEEYDEVEGPSDLGKRSNYSQTKKLRKKVKLNVTNQDELNQSKDQPKSVSVKAPSKSQNTRSESSKASPAISDKNISSSFKSYEKIPLIGSPMTGIIVQLPNFARTQILENPDLEEAKKGKEKTRKENRDQKGSTKKGEKDDVSRKSSRSRSRSNEKQYR